MHPHGYTLEARRLGIGFLSPDVNASREHFYPEYREGKAFLRVPLWKVKGLTEITDDQIKSQVRQTPVTSLSDFYQRVTPAKTEAQNLTNSAMQEPTTHASDCYFNILATVVDRRYIKVT